MEDNARKLGVLIKTHAGGRRVVSVCSFPNLLSNEASYSVYDLSQLISLCLFIGV